MTRFHHIVSGIILLTLFFSVGVACAAAGDTANLSVSKVVSSAAPYETGKPVTWTVTLSNAGPANATNISLAESISGFSGEIQGVADLGTYNNTTGIWNITRLDNATSANLTIITIFTTAGTKTNNADILHLDETSHKNKHAEATVAINNAAAAISDQPLTVNLTIRPNTLNLKSRGVFTVFVTLNGGDFLPPSGARGKPRVDFANSSLTCSGAEMIRASISNKDGGTLMAKFHRQDLENVTSGDGVQITCSGTLSVNGTPVNVEGSDTIRVIGEKKGLDKIISGLLKYLGLEKDEIEFNETEDGNVTVSFTLDPDNFRNNGQAKKALNDPNSDTPSGKGQNAADKAVDKKENAAKNNGRDKNIRENNAGNNSDNGNKNTDKDEDVSNGKSNGKKNT
jgi:uncharacterized repeat protein (TIGR01451 family)